MNFWPVQDTMILQIISTEIQFQEIGTLVFHLFGIHMKNSVQFQLRGRVAEKFHHKTARSLLVTTNTPVYPIIVRICTIFISPCSLWVYHLTNENLGIILGIFLPICFSPQGSNEFLFFLSSEPSNSLPSSSFPFSSSHSHHLQPSP